MTCYRQVLYVLCLAKKISIGLPAMQTRNISDWSRAGSIYEQVLAVVARILGSRTETINQSIIITPVTMIMFQWKPFFFEHCMADMFAIDICCVLLQFLPCAKHEQHHTIRNDACRQRSNLVDQGLLDHEIEGRNVDSMAATPKDRWHRPAIFIIKHCFGGSNMWSDIECDVIFWQHPRDPSTDFFCGTWRGFVYPFLVKFNPEFDKPLISIPHFGRPVMLPYTV